MVAPRYQFETALSGQCDEAQVALRVAPRHRNHGEILQRIGAEGLLEELQGVGQHLGHSRLNRPRCACDGGTPKGNPDLHVAGLELPHVEATHDERERDRRDVERAPFPAVAAFAPLADETTAGEHRVLLGPTQRDVVGRTIDGPHVGVPDTTVREIEVLAVDPGQRAAAVLDLQPQFLAGLHRLRQQDHHLVAGTEMEQFLPIRVAHLLHQQVPVQVEANRPTPFDSTPQRETRDPVEQHPVTADLHVEFVMLRLEALLARGLCPAGNPAGGEPDVPGTHIFVAPPEPAPLPSLHAHLVL